MSSGFIGRLPEWDGRAKSMGELWRLSKGSRAAVCAIWTHPLGTEIRVDVDGEMVRSEAGRHGPALIEMALGWRTQFEEKGWTD